MTDQDQLTAKLKAENASLRHRLRAAEATASYGPEVREFVSEYGRDLPTSALPDFAAKVAAIFEGRPLRSPTNDDGDDPDPW